MNNTLLWQPLRQAPRAAPGLALLLSLGLAACDSGSSGSRTTPIDTFDGNLELSGWIGTEDSQFTISGDFDGSEGLTFYIGRDPDCDAVADGESCAHQYRLTEQPFAIDADNAFTLLEKDLGFELNNYAYARLRQGKQEATTFLSTQWLPVHSRMRAAYFQGRFWLIGYNESSEPNEDLWSSADGVNWRKETSVDRDHPGQEHLFRNREGHQLVVFDPAGDEPEQLWLIGGGFFESYEPSGPSGLLEPVYSYKNDIWSSKDGIHWSLRQPNADFSARMNHQVTVFDADGNGEPELWLLGGNDGSAQGDVWTSTDGKQWNPVTLTNTEAGAELFSARDNHQLVVFDEGKGEGEQLWLIGSDDVWSSNNGSKWTQVLEATPFPTYDTFRVAVFDAQGDDSKAQLWLVGGDISGNDVWSSPDGKEWTPHTEPTDPPFPGRRELVVVDADHDGNDELWALGGYPIDGSANGAAKTDAWSTLDGDHWTQQTPLGGFSARFNAQTVSFDAGQGERLWMVAGVNSSNGATVENDVWSSADGLHWQQMQARNSIEGGPLFAPRSQHQLVVFDAENDEKGPQLWLIGGKDAGEDDVWSSPDGVLWTQHTLKCGDDKDTCFGIRQGHQVVVYDDDPNDTEGEKLWLIGGTSGSDKNDVWSSEDGENWVEETASADFGPRRDHQVVVFDADPTDSTPAALWLVGGEGLPLPDSETTEYLNDVWTSTDGKKWDLADCDPCFSGRSSHQLVAYTPPNQTQQQLWLIGGANATSIFGDIWTSANGTKWKEISKEHPAPFTGRYSQNLVVFGDNPDQPEQKALLLIGGRSVTTGLSNEVWRSTNGTDWRLGFKSPLQTSALAGQ